MLSTGLHFASNSHRLTTRQMRRENAPVWFNRLHRVCPSSGHREGPSCRPTRKLPNDVGVPSLPSLLSPANHLLFAAI